MDEEMDGLLIIIIIVFIIKAKDELPYNIHQCYISLLFLFCLVVGPGLILFLIIIVVVVVVVVKQGE